MSTKGFLQERLNFYKKIYSLKDNFLLESEEIKNEKN
jgi:hypothetical protein